MILVEVSKNMNDSEQNFTREMFQKIDRTQMNAERISRPTIKYWADVFRRLKMNKLAMFGLCMIIILAIMAIVGRYISGYTYFDQDYANMNIKPNSSFWFGTDSLGRDIFTRIWYGTGYSLLIGAMTSFISFTIGILYGGFAGITGGKVDMLMMRIAEIIYSIPYLLIVILLSVVFSSSGGSSFFVIIFALSFTSWTPLAILVRGQVLQLKQSEYALASTSIGASKWYILRKHIIPNSMGPILVDVTLTVPRAIFSEATLGFLGLGLQAPKASLGTLVNDGLTGMAVGNFYQIIIPAIFISLIMFSFNVLGDGLRDSLDPRLRK
ncbi:MAG: ABC transporter permease [Peptoanaerobacter stomatis]